MRYVRIPSINKNVTVHVFLSGTCTYYLFIRNYAHTLENSTEFALLLHSTAHELLSSFLPLVIVVFTYSQIVSKACELSICNNDLRIIDRTGTNTQTIE